MNNVNIDALLKVIIPASNFGFLLQAFNKISRAKNIDDIVIASENVPYTEKCTVFFHPKDGKTLTADDKEFFVESLSDVMTQYGALVAEENKKPVFEFFSIDQVLNKISEKTNTEYAKYVSAKIDITEDRYGWISFYSKGNYSEESLIKEISLIIRSVIRDLIS